MATTTTTTLLNEKHLENTAATTRIWGTDVLVVNNKRGFEAEESKLPENTSSLHKEQVVSLVISSKPNTMESERSVRTYETGKSTDTTSTTDDGVSFFQRQQNASEFHRTLSKLSSVGLDEELDDGNVVVEEAVPSPGERKTNELGPRGSISERLPANRGVASLLGNHHNDVSIYFPEGPPIFNNEELEQLDHEDMMYVCGEPDSAAATTVSDDLSKSERSERMDLGSVMSGSLRFSERTAEPPSSLTNYSSYHAGSIRSQSSQQHLPAPLLTGGTPMSGSSNRPILYSAIGSLESASGTSFGRIRSQPKNFLVRDFPRPALSTLIPPGNAARIEQQRSSLLPLPQTVVESHSTRSKNLLMAVDTTVMPSQAKVVQAAAPTSSKPKVKQRDDLPSSMKKGQTSPEKKKKKRSTKKKVVIEEKAKPAASVKKKPVNELFRPSSDAYTPRSKRNIRYKPAEQRTPVQKMSTEMGTLHRPNFKDALRRVAMIVKQHIVKIERRKEGNGGHFLDDNLFRESMQKAFSEDRFATPRFKCTMVRVPMARSGMVYGLRKLKPKHSIPTEQEIYEFAHRLFKSVQLSSECSIVCLIYVERLMEEAKVPLLASTWRPIFMCGLLLASKVWQDLSSWNIEFASVYPQFALDSINKLEVEFLRMVKWDLYISSSLYAKYYFALRSILEKPDFRQRYNRMVGGMAGGVHTKEAMKVQQRSTLVREEALLQLSRSM